MDKNARIRDICMIWKSARAMVLADPTMTPEKAREIMATWKATDDARERTLRERHGNDAELAIDPDLTEQDEEELVNALVEGERTDTLNDLYDALTDELIELGATNEAARLVLGNQQYEGDDIPIMYLIDRLVEKGRVREARTIAQRYLRGPSFASVMVNIASATRDRKDIANARKALTACEPSGIGNDFLANAHATTAVSGFARLWMVSGKEKDIASARRICSLLTAHYRCTALRAIARTTWRADDLVDAIVAAQQQRDLGSRDHETRRCMALIADRLRILKGEGRKVFAATAIEVAKHLMNPRLRKFIVREVGNALNEGALA